MFNIGGGELLVIALIALIVLGPQRLPDAARQVGKAMGELRRLSSGFQNELRDAFTDPEIAGGSTPRRHALTAPADGDTTSSTVTDAVAAVSRQSVARRAPLKAAPAKKAPIKKAPNKAVPVPTAPVKRATPPTKAASAKAAPVPKARRLPGGG